MSPDEQDRLCVGWCMDTGKLVLFETLKKTTLTRNKRAKNPFAGQMAMNFGY